VRVLEVSVIFSLIFLVGFSVQESHSDGWSDAVKLVLQEYVDDNLLQNKTILKDSIKTRILGTPEDILPPKYFIKILYDVIDNKEIQHIDSRYKVDFGPLARTPENANLVKIYEMEYIPPKKIVYDYDLENEQLAKSKYQMIMCRQGFEKIMKETTGDTVCVKPETALKLKERGWAFQISK